jgi:hypothetical protein
MKTVYVSYGTVLVRNYAQCTLLRFAADTIEGLKCVIVVCLV